LGSGRLLTIVEGDFVIEKDTNYKRNYWRKFKGLWL
jgi:hypothetical protein